MKEFKVVFKQGVNITVLIEAKDEHDAYCKALTALDYDQSANEISFSWGKFDDPFCEIIDPETKKITQFIITERIRNSGSNYIIKPIPKDEYYVKSKDYDAYDEKFEYFVDGIYYAKNHHEGVDCNLFGFPYKLKVQELPPEGIILNRKLQDDIEIITTEETDYSNSEKLIQRLRSDILGPIKDFKMIVTPEKEVFLIRTTDELKLKVPDLSNRPSFFYRNDLRDIDCLTDRARRLCLDFDEQTTQMIINHEELNKINNELEDLNNKWLKKIENIKKTYGF